MPRHKIKAYSQLEYADCGITCIRIIARYWGLKISNKMLCKLCDISRNGITIGEMVRILDHLHLKATALKVGIDNVAKMPLPAILFWEQHHFVALYRYDAKRGLYHIVDPGQGKLVMSEDEFSEKFLSGNDRGIAILCGPDEDFSVSDNQADGDDDNALRHLGSVMKKSLLNHKWQFTIVILLTLISLGAAIATPLIFRRTIDDGIAGHDIGLVWILIASQFCIFLGNQIADWTVEITLTKLNLKVGINMLNEYLEKLIKMPIDFFNRKVKSDLIQKAEDQNRIRNFIVNTPASILFTTLNLIVFSGVLIYFNKWIFLLFTAFTAINFLWTSIFLKRRRAIDFATNSNIAENRNNLHELVHGIEEIRVNNACNVRISVWNKVQQRINELSIKSTFLNFYVNGGNSFFTRIRDISITGICATLVINGSMSLGTMMTVSFIAGQLSAPFNNLLRLISNIQDAKMSCERVNEIIESNPSKIDCGNEPAPNGDICLKEISFKYPGAASPFVIHNLSQTIKAGTTTAIVGESGCGKSTLIKLILGLYQPTSGEIKIGDWALTQDNSERWLSQCSTVMQDGMIFSGSLLSNIALCDEVPDKAKAMEAVKIACLDDFIRQLPMGLNTKIGVTGVNLSGGQTQRLLIARAVYKNPSLLVLDEATSSLDALNESEIVEKIKNFSQGRTVIIAAHRLSTVSYADNIIFLDKGKIVEQGTHDELIALRGHYYQLVEKQLF